LDRSRLGPAVCHRSGLTPAVNPRSGPASLSLLGKCAAEDVRVGVPVCLEGRESHEQDEYDGTREAEWHMVAKKAATQVAARARLTRRSAS
jgi:hypothetical protein